MASRMKDQKRKFVNPFNKNIGRRTGKTIKAGKKIRLKEDGFENFEDYLSESDADMTREVLRHIQEESEGSGSQGSGSQGEDRENNPPLSNSTAVSRMEVSSVPSQMLHSTYNTTVNQSNSQLSQGNRSRFAWLRNRNIGRRTGQDVKGNKQIRRDADGFENFEDYLSESEAESFLSVSTRLSSASSRSSRHSSQKTRTSMEHANSVDTGETISKASQASTLTSGIESPRNHTITKGEMSTTMGSMIANDSQTITHTTQANETELTGHQSGSIIKRKMSQTMQSTISNVSQPITQTTHAIGIESPGNQSRSVTKQKIVKSLGSIISNESQTKAQSTQVTQVSEIASPGTVTQRRVSKTMESTMSNDSQPVTQTSELESLRRHSRTITRGEMSKRMESTIGNDSQQVTQTTQTTESVTKRIVPKPIGSTISNVSQRITEATQTDGSELMGHQTGSATKRRMSNTMGSTISNDSEAITQTTQASGIESPVKHGGSTAKRRMSNTMGSTISNDSEAITQTTQDSGIELPVKHGGSTTKRRMSKTLGSTISNDSQQITQTLHASEIDTRGKHSGSATKQRVSKNLGSTVSNDSQPATRTTEASETRHHIGSVTKRRISKTMGSTIDNDSQPASRTIQASGMELTVNQTGSVTKRRMSRTAGSTINNDPQLSTRTTQASGMELSGNQSKSVTSYTGQEQNANEQIHCDVDDVDSIVVYSESEAESVISVSTQTSGAILSDSQDSSQQPGSVDSGDTMRSEPIPVTETTQASGIELAGNRSGSITRLELSKTLGSTVSFNRTKKRLSYSALELSDEAGQKRRSKIKKANKELDKKGKDIDTDKNSAGKHRNSTLYDAEFVTLSPEKKSKKDDINIDNKQENERTTRSKHPSKSERKSSQQAKPANRRKTTGVTQKLVGSRKCIDIRNSKLKEKLDKKGKDIDTDTNSAPKHRNSTLYDAEFLSLSPELNSKNDDINIDNKQENKRTMQSKQHASKSERKPSQQAKPANQRKTTGVTQKLVGSRKSIDIRNSKLKKKPDKKKGKDIDTDKNSAPKHRNSTLSDAEFLSLSPEKNSKKDDINIDNKQENKRTTRSKQHASKSERKASQQAKPANRRKTTGVTKKLIGSTKSIGIRNSTLKKKQLKQTRTSAIVAEVDNSSAKTKATTVRNSLSQQKQSKQSSSSVVVDCSLSRKKRLKKKSTSAGDSVDVLEDDLMASPEHHTLVNTATPQSGSMIAAPVCFGSGVSFRVSRRSEILDGVQSGYVGNVSVEMEPTAGLTPCITQPGKSRKSKGRRVTICPDEVNTTNHLVNKFRLSCDSAAGTPLPTPSSTPVHYCEVTHTATPHPGATPNISVTEDRLLFPDPPSNGLRRSQRTRVKPVQWFKNEVVVYNYTKSGMEIAGVKPSREVLYLKKDAENRQKRRLRLEIKKASLKQTRSSKSSRRLSIHTELPEGFVPMESPNVAAYNPDTHQQAFIECICKHDTYRPVGPLHGTPRPDDPYTMTKMVDQPIFSCGELVLRPEAKKPRQLVNSDAVQFRVEHGKVMVTIHNTTTLLETGDVFFVPKGNTYSIANLRRDDAKLFYTIIKLLDVDDEGSLPENHAML